MKSKVMTRKTHFHLKLCYLQNLKKHVSLKPHRERLRRHCLLIFYYVIPVGVGQNLAFLNISEKSIEALKSFMQKNVSPSTSISSNTRQNFL